MTMQTVLSDIGSINDKYVMFNRFTEDSDPGDSKFLFSAKDNLTSKDFETCCAFRILEGYTPYSMPRPSPDKERRRKTDRPKPTWMIRFRNNSRVPRDPQEPFDLERRARFFQDLPVAAIRGSRIARCLHRRIDCLSRSSAECSDIAPTTAVSPVRTDRIATPG